MKRIPRSEGENGVNFGGVGSMNGNRVTVAVAQAIEDFAPLPMIEIGHKGDVRVALFGTADDLRYLAQCCLSAADFADWTPNAESAADYAECPHALARGVVHCCRYATEPTGEVEE